MPAPPSSPIQSFSDDLTPQQAAKISSFSMPPNSDVPASGLLHTKTPRGIQEADPPAFVPYPGPYPSSEFSPAAPSCPRCKSLVERIKALESQLKASQRVFFFASLSPKRTLLIPPVESNMKNS